MSFTQTSTPVNSTSSTSTSNNWSWDIPGIISSLTDGYATVKNADNAHTNVPGTVPQNPVPQNNTGESLVTGNARTPPKWAVYAVYGGVGLLTILLVAAIVKSK